jgi:uncharacterized membrane protein (DUF373 family)
MNISICPYKYILGKPNEGVHSYRIFNIAIINVICTIIVGYFISKYWILDIKEVLIVLFLLGIIVHRLFCVETTIDKLLFEQNKE